MNIISIHCGGVLFVVWVFFWGGGVFWFFFFFFNSEIKPLLFDQGCV